MKKQDRLKGLTLKSLSPFLLFLSITIFLGQPLAQDSYDQDSSEEESYSEQEYTEDGGETYEEDVIEAMEKAQNDPQAAMKELQKHIDPQQMADLQKAMQEGDKEKIEKITKEINLKLTTSGAGLDSMVEVSLRAFRDQKPEDLKKQLKERMQGTLFIPIIETFPKLLDLGVNLLQDPTALPALFSIAKDRKKLLIFLGINILIFIFSKIVKRMKKKQSAFARWLLFASLRFSVLIFFFHKELYPTFLVVKRTFF